jgi:hypothetical protein
MGRIAALCEGAIKAYAHASQSNQGSATALLAQPFYYQSKVTPFVQILICRRGFASASPDDAGRLTRLWTAGCVLLFLRASRFICSPEVNRNELHDPV